MSLKHGPSSEPLRISVKHLFFAPAGTKISLVEPRHLQLLLSVHGGSTPHGANLEGWTAHDPKISLVEPRLVGPS